jgi:hypothetical protein
MSTVAFESRKCEPWNIAIADLGVEAYAVRLYSGDIQLFVRTSQAAMMIVVTTGRAIPDNTRQGTATDLARTALPRLPS